MLEVDIAEPLGVEGCPADEEGDDHGSEQQEHTPLVALLSRALTISSKIFTPAFEMFFFHLKAVGTSA